MKILFVRPRSSPETIGLQHVMIVEPLELETLAALVGPEDTPVIVDMILERRPLLFHLRREKPDVLCVTGYITHVDIMIEYCRIAKEWDPDVRTIVGGVHCEVCPDDLDDPAVDFRVVRNAATVFPLLLHHIRGEEEIADGRGEGETPEAVLAPGGRKMTAGVPAPGGQEHPRGVLAPGRREDPEGVLAPGGSELPAGVIAPGERVDAAQLPPFDFTFPHPRRSLTARYRSRYFYIFHDRVALLKTAFGCPYQCTFCFCRAITDGRYFERPLEDVMTELEGIREREIYIVDDDFLVDRGRVLAFVDENRRRGLDKRYLLYGRADFVARNPDVIREFKTVGLSTVIVGFESFFDEELAQYKKGTTASANREAMNVLRTNGIDCYATVIIPPQWDNRRFAECGAIMKSLGIHYVNLQPLTPLPGTGYDLRAARLVIGRGDHARWDLAHVTLRPEHLTVPEFYRAIIDLYNEVLFQPAILMAYLRHYRLSQIWKMTVGTWRVRQQYLGKIREAKEDKDREYANA